MNADPANPAPPDASMLLPTALRGGGGYIVGGQLARGLIRLGGIILLARLLLPRDYGVFGMALILHGFFAACRDFGLSAAAVRRPALDESDKARLFWLYIGMGALAALLTAASAPIAARAFGEPAVMPLLIVLGCSHLVAAVGALSRIELVLAHRFRTVTAAEVTSFAAGTIAALVAAWVGAGAWALVAMLVVQESVQAGWFLCAAGGRWRAWPGLGESGRAFVRFGVGLTVFSLLNHISQTVDQALIGAWFGAHELGVYGRASFIALLPGQFVLGPLTGWMVQTLARCERAADFRAWYAHVLRAAAYLSAMLAATMLARPEWLVDTLLGDQWTAAIVLVPCFALLTLSQLFTISEAWVLMAAGRSGVLAAWTALRLGGALLACWAAREHGPTGVALALAGWHAVASVGTVVLLPKFSALRGTDFIVPLLRPLIVAALGGVMLALTRSWAAPLSVAATGVALVAAWLGWPALQRDVREIAAFRPASAD